MSEFEHEAHEHDVDCDCCACARETRDLLRAAVLRHVLVIEHWIETGDPASPETSQSIYAQLCEAIGRDRMLTDEERSDCGLCSDLVE